MMSFWERQVCSSSNTLYIGVQPAASSTTGYRMTGWWFAIHDANLDCAVGGDRPRLVGTPNGSCAKQAWALQ
eukprot:12577024-Alexandrium_andersonii.AAC.1